MNTYTRAGWNPTGGRVCGDEVPGIYGRHELIQYILKYVQRGVSHLQNGTGRRN